MKRILISILLCFALILASCKLPTDAPTPPIGDQGGNVGNTGGSDAETDNPSGGADSENGDFGDTGGEKEELCEHKDEGGDEICDVCRESVIEIIDFYVINDLHGKLRDGDDHPGLDELTTYIKEMRKTDDNVILLSSGDMWQGSSESNLTSGLIITDWMNELDFAAMTLGNHEYDFGEDVIEMNAEAADFPMLAINVFDRQSGTRVKYCSPSVTVQCGNVSVGIIGAIGDCYSSIAPERVEDVYFKVGSELTKLVKDEARRLRESGVDLVVYSIHDGYSSSSSGSISSSYLSSYYDPSLSEGYVDLVFEGHTHRSYVLKDSHGVAHLQGGGDNDGITHAEIRINSVTKSLSLSAAETVPASVYENYADDPLIDSLLEKYSELISKADEILGNNARYRNSAYLCQSVAMLYYNSGVAKWGKQYDIALGGGFLSARSPYNLNAGEVTYGDLQAIFPFDNEIVLCKISGSDLKKRFFDSNDDRYYIYYGEYGESIKNSIDPNKTYYIVTDSYCASYAPNGLTVVASYGDGIYARDLLAEFIKSGGLE